MARNDNDNDDPAEPPAPRRPRPGRSTMRQGSFRAGSPLPTLKSTEPRNRILRRQSTQHHYQTFPTPPPKTPGPRRPSSSSYMSSELQDGQHHSTPLPVRQLALLALLSLSEQTALNSISPYLPQMVQSFPGVDEANVGLYVGTLASAFALAQLTTNLLWGYLSDIVGRKPVMLLGTSLLCVCFVLFGFSTRYAHIVAVHVAMGLLNGNAAVVPTCLGELTDRSNQSRAFIWLPVVYSLGSITGPALGGLLVNAGSGGKYPYLAPNILGASLLALSVVVLAIWFDETLEDVGPGYSLGENLGWLCACLRKTKKTIKRKALSRRPTDCANEQGQHDQGGASESRRLLGSRSDLDSDDDSKNSSDQSTWRDILNRTTVILLITYLFFQVSNISFSSLYPLFASATPPTGRGLRPDGIGISLSVAGLFTVLFQLFLFRPLKAKLGNLGTYRVSLLGFAVSMALMPFVGYVDSSPPFGIGSSKIWLYVEMGVVLVIKNICAVGGLSSVMLLITNSAPSHSVLGTLNGVAQTLSALGRSFGPFVSGSLFSLSVKIEPKGEALAWGLFGGVALAGWLLSCAIHGKGLESTDDGFDEEEAEEEQSDIAA